jgi:hypothetical protein
MGIVMKGVVEELQRVMKDFQAIKHGVGVIEKAKEVLKWGK